MLSTALLMTASMVVGQAGQPENGGPTAEAYYECMEYYVGNWKATTKKGDEVTREDVSIEWSAMKRCQVVKVVRDGQIIRHALWGYAHRLKRWGGMAFNADGSTNAYMHRPEILEAKYGKPFKTEAFFTTEMKGESYGDSSRKGEWTTTLIDENTYEIKVYLTEDGKRELLWETRLERQGSL